MAVTELASVDGTIAPTAETQIPIKDDGLYRGDGVFEVIRLYGGRPFALADHLDRLERSAAAIDLDAQREALAPEIDALIAAHGDADAQLRLVVTRGGRRIALIEPLVEHLPSVDAEDRRVLADDHPHRRQVALLRRQHARDPDREGGGRRRGAARAAGRRRPRAADVDDLLGLRRRAADPVARVAGSSTRSPAAPSSARSPSPRASTSSPTRSARARSSSPRPCARSSR